MRVMFFANSAWYLFNFRLALAESLRAEGHEVILVSPAGGHGQALREAGFRWIEAPMDRQRLDPFRELRLLAWLRRLLVSERVDLLHDFTLRCAVVGSLAARWSGGAGGVARVNAITGLGYAFTSDDLRARAIRPILRWSMKAALGGRRSRTILQNPDDAALLARLGVVDPALIRVIPSSGVDCDKFAPGPARPAAPDPIRVLLPARLLWDKGVAEYVEAARRSKAEGRRIEFLIAGTTDPGNPASVGDAEAERWQSEGVVRLLGHVDDMPALLAGVDVVVLPSHREGLPKSLIEAGACGRAIVTTDAPGCREVVTDGVDGLLVPLRDPQALMRAISRLAEDPGLRERLGRNARAKVLATFDERIVIERTKAVYAELVDGSASVA